MAKTKTLLPSLKEKRRYLVYEVLSENNLNLEDVKDALPKELDSFLGRLEGAKANVEVLKDWKDKKGVLKVNNKYVDHVKSSFVMLRKINKREAILRTVGVSGTLNKARSKFMA